MSDRRAVTAGRLEAPSVAGEMWRVAVGGNRVENMTVAEIAHAYHSGHLTARTPLWPPGTSGWQALGNFEQFQYAPAPHEMMAAAPYQGGGEYQQLSQFQEGDDDPTRMWTGAGDLEMSMPAPMAAAPMPSAPPPARPSARTGPRQVSSPAPRPMTVPPAARAQRAAASAPTASPSVPPFRTRRSSGWLLVAGLVGLVGLGSAVLAARGNWSSAAMAKLMSSTPEPTAQAETSPAPSSAAAPAPEATAAAPSPAGEAPGVNGVAKYEESGASAFVAGAEPAKAAEAEPASDSAKPGEAEAKNEDAANDSETSTASTPSTSRRSRSGKETSAKAQPAPKRSLSSKTSSAQNAKRATASSKSKAEASESEEPAPAPSSAPAAAGSSVNEAAAAALASSAKLASSCRPRGGPSGAGKARIIYSQDGEVQSVEILTAKFRDTLTGSCVRMVFRRAKIPPFKGEPPTFIKSFTIPEE